MVEQTVIYTPPPTVGRFIASNASVNGIMGPVGSGKSVGSIMGMFQKAAEQFPCTDGIRKSRWVIVRNTQTQLRDTSWASFKEWFPPGIAGEWKEQAQTFIFKNNDIEATFLGRALDTPQDVGRLLSLDVTGGWVNEARELPQEIFEGLLGRCGRYKPDKHPDAKRGWYGLFFDTNAPQEGSYWQEKIENPPPDWAIFRQPAGGDAHAENTANLPPDYYKKLRANNSAEWSRVYIDCHYGLGNAGKPVWSSFNRSFHVAPEPLSLRGVRGITVIIGMDFGLTPAAVVTYSAPNGQIQVVDELWEADMGITRFVTTRLKPWIRRHPEADVLVIGDPAGHNRTMNDEKSCFKILKDHGLDAKEASTNAIVPRVDAVETLLTRMIDGQAGFIVSPHCTHLIRALSGGYRYAMQRGGTLDSSPQKNAYSHIADALQYAALYHEDGAKRQRRNRHRPPLAKPWQPADKKMGY